MTVSIYFRKSSKKNDTNVSIYIRYRHKKYEKLFPTGIRIDKDNWNHKSGRIDFAKGIKTTKQNESLIRQKRKQSASANTQVETIKSKILDIAQRLINNEKEPTPKAISSEMEALDNQTKDPESAAVIELFQRYIDGNKSVLSDSTIKQHNSGFETFKSFLDTQAKKPDRLSDIDYDFYTKYVSWLSAEKKLSRNTVWGKIKWLKSALNEYQRRGYKVANLSNFNFKRENPGKILYCHEDELITLEKYDYEDAKYLDRVRDIFVFGCNTGLRYSDVKRLGKQHIKNGVLELKAYKNQKDVFVPLNKKAVEILQKYKYKLPIISEQKFNEFIKEAFKRAELEREIERMILKDGKKQIGKLALHQVASSHLAVRTFISRCVHKGIMPADVAKMTGKTTKILIDHYYGELDNNRLTEVMKKAFN